MSDNNNDKPFSCDIKGCEMKYLNYDHLKDHKKKHKLKLKFPQEFHGISIEDQTPTPTRFLEKLQNWNEVGLDLGLNHEIQQLTHLTPILNDNEIHNKRTSDGINTNSKSSSIASNPFDASFENALKNNSLKRIAICSKDTLNCSYSPLNTPAIPTFLSSNEGLMAIADAALNNSKDNHFNRIEPQINSNSKAINAISNETSLSSQSSNSSCIDANSASFESSDTSYGKSVSEQSQTNPINKVNPQKFQAVSVICSANTNFINSTVSQTIPNIVISQPNSNQIKSNLRTVPIAQNSKNAAIIAPKTKESSITIGNANSLYKVILKFPDGKTVQLPLLQQQIVSSGAQTITAITNPSKINLNNISNNETIHLSNKISIGSSPSQAIQTSGTSFTELQSRVDATLASLPPKAKPGRKSKFAPEEDPKEKKARSLERNRAAAMRCRLKRKHWIDSLEEKADEYEKINEKLQSEVVVLRKEVTLLKTALLAHKDCPVTLQQQKTNNVSTECITIITTNGNSITNGMT